MKMQWVSIKLSLKKQAKSYLELQITITHIWSYRLYTVDAEDLDLYSNLGNCVCTCAGMGDGIMGNSVFQLHLRSEKCPVVMQ